MKKITTYALLVASILLSACVQEIPVSVDHDINAEVGALETTFESKTLYCNLTDATALDMQKVAEYLTEQNADVVTFLSDDSNFEAWLQTYAEANEYNYLVQSISSSTTIVGCLSKGEIATFADSFNNAIITAPVLHFAVEGIHYVVTELKEGGLVMADGSHNPDELYNDTRKAQVENIISTTIDNSAYFSADKWLFTIDMNSTSTLDISQYRKSDVLAENCVANDVMIYNGLVDCIAVNNNYYQASSTDRSRHNFLYTTVKSWQMMQPVVIDKTSTMGVAHYPIMVTLKSEE